jgi:hypothetical protein
MRILDDPYHPLHNGILNGIHIGKVFGKEYAQAGQVAASIDQNSG